MEPHLKTARKETFGIPFRHAAHGSVMVVRDCSPHALIFVGYCTQIARSGASCARTSGGVHTRPIGTKPANPTFSLATLGNLGDRIPDRIHPVDRIPDTVECGSSSDIILRTTAGLASSSSCFRIHFRVNAIYLPASACCLAVGDSQSSYQCVCLSVLNLLRAPGPCLNES